MNFKNTFFYSLLFLFLLACGSNEDLLPPEEACQGIYRLNKVLYFNSFLDGNETIIHYDSLGRINATEQVDKDGNVVKSDFWKYKDDGQLLAYGTDFLGDNPTIRHDYEFENDRVAEVWKLTTAGIPGTDLFISHVAFFQYADSKLKEVNLVKIQDTFQTIVYTYSENDEKIEVVRTGASGNIYSNLGYKLTKHQNPRATPIDLEYIPIEYYLDTLWNYRTGEVTRFDYKLDTKGNVIEMFQNGLSKEKYEFVCD